MKRMKKRIPLFFLLVLLCLGAAFSAQAAPRLNRTTAKLALKQKYTLRVTGIAKGQKVVWASSNKKAVTVNKKGVIQAKNYGAAYIYATIGKIRLRCKVTVPKPYLNVRSTYVPVGDVLALKVIGGSGKVKWTTSKKKVAVVNARGVVTGLAAGATRITAVQGKAKMVCTIVVTNPVISANAASMRVGEKVSLSMRYTGPYTRIYWSSTNPGVASVDAKGVVTANKAGSAVIRAYVARKFYTCTVTVKAVPAKTSAPTTTKTTTNTSKSSSSGTPSSSTTPASTASKSSTSTSTSTSTKVTTTPNNNGTTTKTTTQTKVTTTTTTTVRNASPGTTTVVNNNTSSADSGLQMNFASMGEYADEGRSAFSYMRSQYKEGFTWTNSEPKMFNGSALYEWNGGIYRGGYGCAAFCFLFSDKIFGTNQAVRTPMSEISSLSQIRVGDILRTDYDTHSVFVLQVNSDHVIVAEANYNKSVHWGRKITWTELKKSGTNVMSRYNRTAAAKYNEFMKIRSTLPILR